VRAALSALLCGALSLACAGVPLPGSSSVLGTSVKTRCYDWPGGDFSRKNRARVSTFLQAGDRGVDVSLRDLDGDVVTIGSLLAEGKPVLLTTASVTCPVFQERHPALQKTIAAYQDRVTFATVYQIEAHPKGPDVGPYKGQVSEHEYSDRGQANTLAARTANARGVRTVAGERLLVDDLTPGNENPFWCTWGTCANCAYLLKTDGTLAAVHEWYDPATMEASLASLVGPP
jgi:hypothetical protein